MIFEIGYLSFEIVPWKISSSQELFLSHKVMSGLESSYLRTLSSQLCLHMGEAEYVLLNTSRPLSRWLSKFTALSSSFWILTIYRTISIGKTMAFS